ncbi:hypothetical protein IVB11_31360 [Bradyrhizobium sp. 177]|uniref:hypothetical protein n=1 Tax=Bradyrhizobium sp. 177 TaxID=2782647 RepID=UPI001FF988BD|nr:hypothetical protein [Bradyrhizobium sp. 177]MCK1553426.1 hypothetical protein [Bradyrhizobium sp. 177]
MNWEELYQHPIAKALRAVFFQTDYAEYPHATHGGTLFIVKYDGRPYGVTCNHVFGDFDPNMLHVSARTELSPGQMSAKLQNLGSARNLGGAAEGSDLNDLCVIEFADDLAPDFFGDTAWPIQDKAVGSSETGHDLFAIGLSKEGSQLLPNGNFARCLLPLRDRGATGDSLVRLATARYGEAGFETITGMSGAPVFNLTKQVLCGMVLRGGFAAGLCQVRYLDIRHVIHLIHMIHTRTRRAFYYP